MPSVTLIIPTWNQTEYLGRVLSAVAGQSVHPDDVIVADDGSGEMTGKLYDRWQSAQPYRCQHLWQERAGPRRARILNAALARATTEYCVFLEGDSIPHPRFLEDHLALALPGHGVEGPCVRVGKVGTRFFGREVFGRDRARALMALQLGGVTQAFRWPSPRRRLRANLPALGSGNFGAWRADLVSVNGFNEGLPGTAAVDAELTARLLNHGIKFLAVSGRAICYRLWPMPGSGTHPDAPGDWLDRVVRERQTRCAEGLNRHH